MFTKKIATLGTIALMSAATNAHASELCVQAASEAVQGLVEQNSRRSGDASEVRSARRYHKGTVLDIYTVLTEESDGSFREWKLDIDRKNCQIVTIESMGSAN